MKIFPKTYTKQKINFRQTESSDYWYNVIMGGFITCMLIISLGGLLLMKLDLLFLIYPYSVLCIVLVLYYQWKDDNFTIIETNLSKNENLKLVENTLEKLNWKYISKTSKIELEQKKYILKFLEPSILVESKKIYINFKYHSDSRTGRLPFFFGISTFLKRKFIKQLIQFK